MRRLLRANRDGFTLVELLVVIAIIALLVGILVPVVGFAMRTADVTKSRVWIAELGTGCEAYRFEHGAYPGQDYPNMLSGDNGAFTGSQYLGKALFTDPAAAMSMDDPPEPLDAYPQPKYAPYEDDKDLIASNAKFSDGIWYKAVSDRTAQPMPVLYFPARRGVSGLAQFKAEDNPEVNAATFPGFIQDPQQAGVPANAGGFLLIGAGLDRQFLSGDDIKYPPW